ncbi:MAG: hypothetical protein R3C14_10655 [Caldilineaceae bacterium]
MPTPKRKSDKPSSRPATATTNIEATNVAPQPTTETADTAPSTPSLATKPLNHIQRRRLRHKLRRKFHS